MKLGNAAWGFRETPIERQLEITANMGLKILELSIGADATASLKLPASDSSMENIRKLFSNHKIELLCGSTGNDFTLPDTSDNYTQLEEVCKVIDVSSRLGIHYLRIFAGFSPVEQVTGKRWNVMVECLCKVGEYADKKNVRLTLETHGGVEKKSELECRHFHSVTTKLGVLKKLLSEIPDNIGINFDPANLGAVGIMNPENFYTEIENRVNYMHLKDFAPISGTDYLKPVACGEGQLNWEKIISVIQNFQGPALIEYENTDDVEDGCRRSLDFLMKFLKSDTQNEK